MPNEDILSKKQIDGMDLEKVLDENWAKNVECLKKDYGISEERLEDVKKELHKINREQGIH